jgi:hypothetical protein
MNDRQKGILDAIDIKIQRNNETLSFDKTYRGVVQNNLGNNLVTVIINEESYTAKVPNTLTLYANDIVSVTAQGNNFSELLVESVLKGQGGYLSGGGSENPQTIEEIVNALNNSNLIIDDNNLSSNVADSLTKRHEHSNITVLSAMEQAFTTALKNKLDNISIDAKKVASSTTNGNIKIDDIETVVYTHPAGTNPHGTTKADIGLSNVDNIQQATKTEFNTHNTDNIRHITSTERSTWNTVTNKVDVVTGKQLSTEDFTTTEKTKLSNVADYANNYVHPATHPSTIITGLSTVATSGSYNDLSSKPTLGTVVSKNTGITNGTIPIIGADGKLDSSIMPSIVITDTFVVASQTAMLALTAEVGDVCVRTDLSKSFILRLSPASTLSNWQELLTPTDLVQSINGKTGVVTLTASDVSLGNVTNESKSTMFTNPTFTGIVSAPTPTSTDNTTKVATTAFVKNQGYITGINSSNVTNALGYTPLSAIPIATNSTLGGIKVGANLTITADGTLNANDNPASFIKKQERFIKTTGQTIYNLIQGHYQPLTGAISWFLNGAKQSDSIIQQLSSTSFGLPSTISDGSTILVEYYEVINWYPFPIHASEHLTGGVDAIPLATISSDGLMPSTDKVILTNATNSNNASTLVKRDSSGNFSAGTITATLSGNASTSTKWVTARTVATSGDVVGTATSIDGSVNITIPTALASIVTAGTGTKITYDSKGRVTSSTSLSAGDIPTVTSSKISDFASTVLSTVLTGLSAATNAVISATDSVLTALGKLQKQITDNLAILTSHTGNTSNPHSVTKTQLGLGNVDNTADSAKNVLSASKLTTARTVSLTGDVAGSASFNGMSDINIVTVVGVATQTTDGLLSKEDKTKVDNTYTKTETANYTMSRGENLVTNGTGLLSNNYNFSSFAFDGSDAYFSVGSFKDTAYNSVRFNDEIIPVDVNRTYKLSLAAKANPYVGAKYYIGIGEYDADGLVISASNHMYFANTLTTLAQDLKIGDTKVYLTSAANWNNTAGSLTHYRTFIFWGYKNSKGYVFPAQTYSRYFPGYDMWSDGSIDFVNNCITLKSPWSYSNPNDSQGIWKAGTSLSNGSSGGTYKYIAASNITIPSTWTGYSGTIGGVDNTGNNDNLKFSYGTAGIKLLFLNNRDIIGGSVLYSNLSFAIDLANSKHIHNKADVTDMPTKLSQFTNDIGAGGGISTVISTTPPSTHSSGNIWIKPI